MNKIISIQHYKKEKDTKAKHSAKCKSILDKVIKFNQPKIDYSSYSKERLIQKLESLELRHRFDLDFLELVDLFMQEHYPEYSWKFDLFVDKIDKENG